MWQGAEFWVDPEIDQGSVLTKHTVSPGIPSAEAYKLGAEYPYARVQRYFIRQTIDLGGATRQWTPTSINLPGRRTENRLVLTVGKFGIVDIFDTNKYANNPKTDFLNWALINAGTFDYAGDAWGYTYGAAAEWYQGNWTLRGGVFDLTATPRRRRRSPLGYGLDPTFRQFQLVGEIEERHELWGQPGKIKITGFLSRANMGSFQDAINLGKHRRWTPARRSRRCAHYQGRPGVSVNLEQQVNDSRRRVRARRLGRRHCRAMDFADIDHTVSAAFRCPASGGAGRMTRSASPASSTAFPVHQAFLDAGGIGNSGRRRAIAKLRLEKILETYYSYALLPSTAELRLSVHRQSRLQHDRGPVNIFAGASHRILGSRMRM